MGFTISAGDAFEDGTRTARVVFPEGGFLELVASPERRTEALRFVAFSTDSIEATGAAVRAHGADASPDFARTLRLLESHPTGLAHADAPAAAPSPHENAARRLAGVWLAAKDPDAAAVFLARLGFDIEGRVVVREASARGVALRAGRGRVLVLADDGTNGPLAESVPAHGVAWVGVSIEYARAVLPGVDGVGATRTLVPGWVFPFWVEQIQVAATAR